MTNPLQNQFNITPVQGMLDMQENPNTISGQIDVSSAGNLIPGTPVKMVDSAGGVPKFVECAADTDDVLGFINYNIKNSVFNAYDPVEISLVAGGNVMFLTAAAAIARRATVMVVIAGVQVATATSGKTIVGWALDKAVATGDLIRVYMLPPKQSA